LSGFNRGLLLLKKFENALIMGFFMGFVFKNTAFPCTFGKNVYEN